MFYFGLKVTYFLSITFLKPITAGYLAGKKKEKRLYEVFLFQFFFLISINLVSGAGLEPAQCRQSSGWMGLSPIFQYGLHMFINMLQQFISSGAVICHRESIPILGVSLSNIPGNGFEGLRVI